jgi:hypothetical protein
VPNKSTPQKDLIFCPIIGVFSFPTEDFYVLEQMFVAFSAQPWRRSKFDFRAFVLETFGGCVTNVEEVVQGLASLMSHKTASSRADCIEHIWRRLSVALQRGHARCFLQRETFDHESDWIS